MYNVSIISSADFTNEKIDRISEQAHKKIDSLRNLLEINKNQTGIFHVKLNGNFQVIQANSDRTVLALSKKRSSINMMTLAN